ncbi:response regulator [Candidatus Cryosericum hinesii]|uniref:histidine kinase n=2 Tax=Candidatus Cryosericum hinesii TaxID=2290915 RepID=A0A398DC47_9BACT|nr:response regulator [Candidatus Cryosericum hinesii]RIE12685.1 response regulator [Candidatus Cryosericum hinesii]
MLTVGRTGTVTSVNTGRSGCRGVFPAHQVMRSAVGFAIIAVLLLIPISRVRASTPVSSPPQLVVAANIYEPFAFQRDDHLVGFDVDLVNLIASLNGWSVRYETTTFADELQRVQNGTVDLGIGSIFWTSDRASHYAFTSSYLNSGLVLVTPVGSAIHNPRDLGGHRVAVKTGTVSDDYVTSLDDRYGQLQVQRYASPEEVLAALADGQADVAVHDHVNAHFLIDDRYQGILVIQNGDLFTPFLTGRRPVAFPAARNMLPLLSQFNATLAEVRRSGLLAQLETKWFGTTISFYTDTNRLRTTLLVLGGIAVVLFAIYLLASRERAARGARDRAAYYQQLFAAVPEPALLVDDADGQLRIEAVNGALCTLLARKDSDLLGATLGSIMFIGQADVSKTLTSLEDRSLTSARWQFVASDRTLIPVEVMTSNLPTPSKRVLIVARDLRDQLKAEQTVRTAYQQYHALFDEAPDPILIISDHVITQANTAAGRVLATTTEQLTGKIIPNISPAMQPDGRPSADAMRTFEDQALAGQAQRFDWTFVTHDGRQVICEASLQSIPSAGASIVQGIFRDVTEQRLTEERTRQLEKELLQSQKMEAVGRLAGGIAHDFNNLMGGIMGHASLLRVDAMQGTDLYRGLDTIERAARRAADLTHRLLSFSRNGTPTIADVDMGEVLADTLSIAMPGFDKRTVLVQSISPDLAYVPGDRTQLEEVILNLVINARDAMGHHDGTLTVDACNVIIDESFCVSHDVPVLPNGNYLQIRVSDTGCGLSPEARDHLFEPFFTTRPEGTGLGLSIVWRVVHDHGGTITVASVPNQGTTFTLYLPAISRAEAQGRARQTPVSGSLPRSARGESVLIVDDEDVVRSVAVKVLSGLGYHVIDTADPVNALAIYKDSWLSIDLVLVDMMMPHMNGKDLFEKLREINPSVAAILMSGYDATDTPFASTGFVAFIPKPYTLQELATRVRQSLSTPAARASNPSEEPTV